MDSSQMEDTDTATMTTTTTTTTCSNNIFTVKRIKQFEVD
jgi:hypothetical protein